MTVSWMSEEELFEGMMYWQKRALKAEKTIKDMEEYIEELQMDINIILSETEEV